MKSSGYWLLKTEPDTYSFQQLLKEGKTSWNGIRNYQARNFLREAAVGDTALIYHSGDEKAVVGVATITRAAYPDVDPDDASEDWVQIDLKPVMALETPITLAQIKAAPKLKDILLVRQSRLSVTPINKTHYEYLLRLGGMKV